MSMPRFEPGSFMTEREHSTNWAINHLRLVEHSSLNPCYSYSFPIRKIFYIKVFYTNEKVLIFRPWFLPLFCSFLNNYIYIYIHIYIYIYIYIYISAHKYYICKYLWLKWHSSQDIYGNIKMSFKSANILLNL
jgi:hypothetical protein